MEMGCFERNFSVLLLTINCDKYKYWSDHCLSISFMHMMIKAEENTAHITCSALNQCIAMSCVFMSGSLVIQVRLFSLFFTMHD